MSPLRVRYQTIEIGDADIHVRTLRDRQQFCDKDGAAEKLGVSPASWPLFGVIWDSSQILARLMCDFEIKGKRILEVGCGIALASLVLNHRHADITATDYNPDVELFLDFNANLNGDKRIPFTRTGWGDDLTDLGEFDLIIGSDLLYEPDHVEMLSIFIDQHTKLDGEIILVDPGRGNLARFTKRMVDMGYKHQQSRPDNTDYLSKPFHGQVLNYHRPPAHMAQ